MPAAQYVAESLTFCDMLHVASCFVIADEIIPRHGGPNRWQEIPRCAASSRRLDSRRFLQAEASDAQFAELELLYLARHRRGELIHEHHVARHLVVGDLSLAEAAHIVDRQSGTRAEA